MSKDRREARHAIASRVSSRLNNAEAVVDDAVAALSGLLAELPAQRKEAQLSATFGQQVFVSLAAAQQAMVSARGHLVGAHEALATCRDDLRLRMETGPVEDKPPPNSFAAASSPLRLAS